ncbi:MAG: hypothetical protein LIO77_01705 [Rikenellaceae bacterium]|nr:hypothetical protein [Rikenellaceae bacterium]
MGDYKCNSGMSSDKKDWKEDKTNKVTDTYNPETDRNFDPTNKVTESYDPQSSGKDYSGSDFSNKDYSDSNISDSGMDSSDCGCGSTDDILSSDDLADATVIYSETVYFNEPYDYDKADDKAPTSDLIEDEQEGSEFITGDTSRPQC